MVEDLNGTAIGKFCGGRKPPILTSMDSSMFVKFVSDASVARDGFSANYEFLDAMEACGGTFFQESGVIRSPGFPSRYPHSAHCVWIIRTKNNRQITLNVTSFQLEEHTNCRYDFIEIRNGGYETSPLIGKFCGSNILTEVKSHSNVLRLEFKTDNSMSARGFEIYFDSTATGCGGKLTSPKGSIVSPNYPQPYPFNSDCEWLIQVSAGSVISIAIVDVDIEEHRICLYDYIQIYDGPTESSKSLLRICNNQQSPGTVRSTGNSVLIRFRSDFSEEAGGFHLAYQTLCNNNLTSRRGVIESPNFPNTYPHNHNCTWVIQAPRGSNISLAFSHLFLEGGESCNSDYVEVLQADIEGKQTQLGKYCGIVSRPPNSLETSSNTAIVRLVTDQSVTREGFRLEWNVKGCGGDISDKNYGNISSPNYPNGYPFDTTCNWHIFYPPGFQVELTVAELDMEGALDCQFDYLRVFGGEDEHSPRLLNICNRISSPQVVSSHGNHMFVQFSSDISVSRKGFMATFKRKAGGCGGYFKASESTIMSPNFPSPYNANDECDWLIEVDATHLVVLEFYDFNLPVSVNFTKGYVAIYDGNSTAAPLILQHSGDKPEGSFSSTGNQMLVRLVADGNNVGMGFRAHFKTGCGGRLLADDSGVITSPNYPDVSTTITNCSWIIYTSEPGEKVNLIITHLFMPDPENCTYSGLRLIDGDRPDSPVIQDICGVRSPPPVLSRGSILHVFLRLGIFRATYGLASIHCGGSYTSKRGTFGSPGYPYNYELDTECVWTIEASPGNSVQLSFEGFNLEDSDHCNKDYVEIHENDESGKFIGRYCGNRIPTNVTNAPKLWIKFRSDDIDTRPGFMAHYELQHQNNLNGTEGEITSPGFPSDYHETGEYGWTIYVPSGMFVSVRFITLSITSIATEYLCSTAVQIFDGFDDQAASLGEFCGYQIPDPVISTGNVVYIKFHANMYSSGKFHLQWVALTESGIVVDVPETTSGEPCWEEVQLNSSTISDIPFNSPNYPENYPNKINCTYILRAALYQHVELNITELELEDLPPSCNFDRLEVYYLTNPNIDMWERNTTLCGRFTNLFLVSPTNLMKLVFVTDDHISHKGFHSVGKPRCGSHFRGSGGFVKSDYIRSELSQMDRGTIRCEYVITVRQRRTIQLKFDQFNVPSDSTCSTNYILIRNGGRDTSPFLGNGKFCGSTTPPSMETSSNEVFVEVVVSTMSSGAPDFILRYTELSLGCGGHLFLTADTPNVEISSPNYPNPPPHDVECEWTILSPSGTRMRMDFDSEFRFGPQCYAGDDVEFLQTHDGGTEMAEPLRRFCGNEQPSSVLTTGNALFTRYVTAVANPQAGFKARIRIAVCGGTVASFHGVITSPNYPNNYGNSQDCEWILKMMRGYHIILNLTDLNTPSAPPGQSCSATDYLEIRNFDENGEVLGIFCGALTNSSQIIDVPSDQAYVKFKSNSATTAKGFSLTMTGKNDDCNRYYDSPSGVITSPNYPNAVSSQRMCRWRIMAPAGRKVKLTFQEFNLPMDESLGICPSFIEAYNTTYWGTPLPALRRCGNMLPKPIESSSSSLMLRLFTHGLSAGQGFSLTYTTEEEGICGGILELPSGVISTPNFTIQNNSYVDCRWKTNAQGYENTTLVYRFDVLDTPGIMANYCRDGALYIFGEIRYLGRFCGNYTTEVVVTSPSVISQVRFIANLGKPMRGIHGIYEVKDCGGIISSANAEIMSPGYPSGYPTDSLCHWLIYAPEGETITLTVDDLRMEEDCEKDYVLVRNGYHLQSPVLGRFCGSHVPAPITSTGSYLTVIFQADAYGTAPGFRMTTAELQKGCGGLIHTKKGNLSSPNFPSHYDNNVECRWIIEFIPGYVVKLEFTGRFDIEMDSACSKDYLMVEEYSEDGTWSEKMKKCGPANPEPYISKTRKLRITFHTNDRITGDGFNIAFSAVCGGNFTALNGEIFSPNYPDFYDNSLSCEYTIGKPSQYISLSFDSYFSLENNNDCAFDHLRIYHGNVTNSTEQGPYCGSEAPAPRTLLGPVTIRFVTDDSYTAHGFRAQYEILDCGATLTAPTGVISTPRTPTHYLREIGFDMDCTWQILAPSDKVIVLRFSYFDLGLNYRCWRDYLQITDGLDNGPLIGKICGNKTTLVKSTGNVLTLKLHMFSASLEKGFSAFYHTTYGIDQGCGGTLNMSSGEIQSLDIDSDGFYEPSLDCSWLVIGNNADQVFQITFERFDIEPSPNSTCIYDFLELREDINPESGLIGRYCGSVKPTTIITSGNRMNVIFHSDQKTNKAGFKLRFQTVASPCGPSALLTQQEPQTLTSPNYPNPYPVNLRCKWTITRNLTRNEWPREMIQLTVTQLDVPCDGDYVEVQKMRVTSAYQRRYYVGHPAGSGQPVRLCGSTAVHDILVYSGMTVTFQSDGINNGARGFSLSYMDENCNRTLTRDSDVITSSGYPGRYNSASKCTKTILTTPGKTISVYFSRLELYDPEKSCPINNIKLYDGANNSAPFLGSFCGFDPPNPIFTSGHALYFESNMSHNMGLYYMIYMTTDQGRGCGGSIYAEEGTISSPLYPQTCTRNAECVWQITVPGYHTVKLEFKVLVLNSTAGCDSNYVEIYDGNSGLIEERVVRYCGTDTPGTHISRTSEVVIKFKSDSTNSGPGFLLSFTMNNFLPDTSLSLIQRHSEERRNENDKFVYLT